MARTRDTPGQEMQHTVTPADSNIPSKSTRKGTQAAKPAPKSKRSREAAEAEDTMTVELEQPAPGPVKKAKTTAGNPKRQRDADDTARAETEQAVPTKKMKTAPKKTETAPKKDENISPRRSSRVPSKAPAAPQKRKRRTKEEMAADKAKADAEKRQKEELTEKNRQAMMRMDINEDIDRAEAVAKTIRTFTDIDRAKIQVESDAEEFVGYNEVSSSDDSVSESGGRAEDAAKSKVRFMSHLT